ncbi:hypothetical protein LCGC14_1054740 [marine sediment metagenome]|uniref:Nucleotidyltransferase n=1 Tax=marine sediment metagenome TaxID=412755 RepID=A0A0F9QTU3_9ZZZZ
MAESAIYVGELKNKVADEGGKIINLMISGSHLFGFESPDSDTDYRGCYQLVTNKLLTTRKPRDFIEYKLFKEGMTLADTDKYDVYDKEAVLDELNKEVGLLLAGNCNHWEHLTADQLITTETHREMQKIFETQININGIYHSYRGMADQNNRKFIRAGKHSVKKYLYVLRGLMAGYWAIDTGTIQPNIGLLATEYGSTVTEELIELKKRGTEKGLVNKNKEKYDREVDMWFKLIDDHAKQLPIIEQKEVDERRSVLDEWILKKRLGFIDGYK